MTDLCKHGLSSCLDCGAEAWYQMWKKSFNTDPIKELGISKAQILTYMDALEGLYRCNLHWQCMYEKGHGNGPHLNCRNTGNKNPCDVCKAWTILDDPDSGKKMLERLKFMEEFMDDVSEYNRVMCETYCNEDGLLDSLGSHLAWCDTIRKGIVAISLLKNRENK